MTDSFGALHAPLTAALLASPLKNARQRYVPAAVGVNAADVAVAFALPAPLNVSGRFDDVKIAVAHVASFGPYRRNSTVPTPAPAVIGFTSPVMFAASVSDPAPSMIGSEACVEIAGVAGLTTTDSSAALHAPLTALLFASPLKNARQRYVPVAVGVNGADVAVASVLPRR